MGRKNAKHVQQFIDRVAAGEEKSVAEWATEVYPALDPHNGQDNVYATMYHARKRGIMMFPVPRASDKKSIVRVVNNNESEFAYSHNRHAERTESYILSNTHIARTMVTSHPALKEGAYRVAKALLNSARAQESMILDVSYEPSSPALASGKS